MRAPPSLWPTRSAISSGFAGAGHERDGGLAEPVEPEVGDGGRAAVALFLVGEPGGEERGQPDRLEAGVAVDGALLGREDDPRSRRSYEQLLAEELDLNAGERDRLRAAALVEPAGDEDGAVLEVDAVVDERDGFGEAQADRAAEGDDALDPLGEPGGEAEQLLVLERLPFAGLDADGIDLEDADVDFSARATALRGARP
jgi:hypothetical protein